ncbi:MAG: hypothetical protein Q4P72_01605 [Eubacteriales bacterium]|nr:hypothetical protein [Eubacteriales bacterium]
MLKLIIGVKGSGKTGKLVDDLNLKAHDNEKNVICIERGQRLDRFVKYHIRLIDINEYPVQGFDELLAFLAGMNAKDYDITHIYIDSIFKVANLDVNYDALSRFLDAFDELSRDMHFEAQVILSADVSDLPENILRYVAE